MKYRHAMEKGRPEGWVLRFLAVLLLLVMPVAACDTLPILTYPVQDLLDDTPDTAKVFFVTDRAPSRDEIDTRGGIYGHGRSASMAFGEAVLGFDRLAVDVKDRAIRVRGVSEQVRFPPTPQPFILVGNVARPDGEAQAGYVDAGRSFQTRVGRALQAAGQDEIVIFVHGYKNDFGNAITTMANIWQATGRSAVPIAYTWPADNPGLFGYFKDRESGEFSIFHLKETLRLLAGVPGLKKIQLIAHSRGTEVATAALREMIIAARAAGKNPRHVLKVDNLILAAPDLDFGVVRQRLIAEKFAPAFEDITVYMNPSDGALGFAQTVNSGKRFGRLSYDDLDMSERDVLTQIGNIFFIDVSGVVAPRKHSYFRENPVVLSDIVSLLHTGARPGEPARNLSHVAANFWKLEQFPDIAHEPIDR